MTQTDPCSASVDMEVEHINFESLRNVAEFLSFFQAQLLLPEDSIISTADDDTTAPPDQQGNSNSTGQGSKRKYQERKGFLKNASSTVCIPTLSGGRRLVKGTELLHRVRPITIQTLQRVLSKRLQNQQKNDTGHRPNQESSSPVNGSETSDSSSSFDAYVSLLIDRLEVWGTKALAQHEFSRLQPTADDISGLNIAYLSNTPGEKITPAILAVSASASLLGLPDGRLMAKYLPTVKINKVNGNGDDSITRSEVSSVICGDAVAPTNSKSQKQQQGDKAQINKSNHYNLPIPPNSLTWKEYLRLCHMLSQVASSSVVKEVLNHLSQCHNSSSTWFDQVLHETHNWTRCELVLTWVRAQRNTAAFRLLLHAFEFHDVTVTTDDDDTTSDHNNNKIVAIFRGNTKLTKTKVKVESDLVDMLVEFVVMNNYLNHFPSSFTSSSTTEQDHRDLVSSSSEKGKVSVNTVAVPPKLLQLFIFRWFARRNKPYLSFAFLPPESSILDIPELTMVEQREYFKRVHTKRHKSEHCLAHIDHNIAEGVYESMDELRQAVLSTLSEFLECSPKKAINLRRGLEKAIDDFGSMLDEFSGSEELHRFIIHILGNNSDKTDATSTTTRFHKVLSDNLKYMPAPWIDDLCPSCPKGALSRKNADYSILGGHSGMECGVCGKMVHKWCARTLKRIRGSQIKDYSPLGRILCARTPPGEDPKSFASTLSWEKKTVTMKREPCENGEIPNWGMLIHHTQDCMDAYEKITSLTWNPTDPHDPYSDILPIFIPKDFDGIIVKDFLHDSVAKISGMEIGDVVTNVYTLDRSLADSSNQKGSIVRKYDLQKITMEEREDLFFQKYTELSLIIQRPSKNIVEFARKWRALAEQSVRSLKGVVSTDYLPDYWCCSNCVDSKNSCCNQIDNAIDDLQDGDKLASQKKGGMQQAALCISLIRRLSFDWYSVPFHDESLVDEKVTNLKSVSLRRLNLMMKETMRSDQQVSATGGNCAGDARPSNHSFPLIGPFYVTYAEQSDSHEHLSHRARVNWALDGLDPTELLCRAMAELLESPPGEDPYEAHRRNLALSFLSLFQHFFMNSQGARAVCKSHEEEEEEEVASTNFHEKNLVTFMPWSLNICRVCGVRSCANSSKRTNRPSFDYCNSFSCLSFINSFDYSDEKADEYYSSFIGSILLALPGDCILNNISKALQVSIDHQGRPIELIVVSYHGSSKNDNHSPDEKEPYFYVFPILYYKVLQHLLSNLNLTLEDLETLPGVVKVTILELDQMLERTMNVYFALDAAVCKACVDGANNQLGSDDFDKSSFPVPCMNTNNERALSSSRQEEISTLTMFTNHKYKKALRSKWNELRFDQSHDGYWCEYWNALVESLSAGNIHAIRVFLDVCENVRHSRLIGESDGDVVEDDDETSIGESDIEINPLAQKRKKQPRLQSPSKSRSREPHALAADLVCVYSDVDAQEKPPSLMFTPSLLNIIEKEEGGTFMCITLQRSFGSDNKEPSGSKVYSGMGWGLVLFKWPNSSIRVGYVSPNSPAALSLAVHDLILKINGRDAKELESSGLLSTALLCLARTSVSAADHVANLDDEDFPKNLSSPCSGPVVVEIFRPALNVSTVSVAQPSSDPQRKERGQPEKKSTYLMKPLTANHFSEHRRDISVNPAHQELPSSNSTSDSWRSNSTASVARNGSVSQPQNIHQEINKSDLYKQGFPGSIITRVETAVLLHCFKLNSPLLGLRLLSPRYPRNVVRVDYDTYISGPARENPFEIPLIPEKVWAIIIQADYKRSLSETGPVIFSEHGFAYRSPHQVLPLDRLMESIVKKFEVDNQRQPYDLQSQHYSGVHNHSHGTKAIPIPSVETGRRYMPSALNGLPGEPRTSETPNQFQFNSIQLQRQVNSNIFSGRGAPSGPPELIDLVDDDDEEGVQGTSSYHASATFKYDQAIARIRGGGTTVLLTDLDRSLWKKQFVVGQCQTTLGSTRTGLATFIGRVSEPADEPEIDVFYVSNGGFLNPMVRRKVAASKLQIATSADEKQIVKEAITRYFTDAAHHSEAVNDSSLKSNKTVAEVPNTLSKASQKKEQACCSVLEKVPHISADLPSVIPTSSFNFITRLLRRSNQANPLGFLPDGHALCWIQSDPRALYIRNLEAHSLICTEALLSMEFKKRQHDYKATLDRNSRRHKINFDISQKYHCLWGCSIPVCDYQRLGNSGPLNSLNSRQAIAFNDSDAYEAHVKQYHCFADGTSARHRMWCRIQEGCDVQHLCLDLTSAVCARSTELISFTAPLSQKVKDMLMLQGVCEFSNPFVVFDERLLRAMLVEGDSLSFKNLPRSLDRGTKDLIRLWSRIYRLFSVEENGLFRFNDKDLYDPYVIKKATTALLQDQFEDAVDVSKWPPPSTYQTCLCYNGSIPGSRECVLCPLCRGIDECVISTSAFGDESSKPSDPENAGIGCSLFSSLFIDDNNLVHDKQQLILLQSRPFDKLPLNVLKNLFLRVALHVPYALRKTSHMVKVSKKVGLGCIRILNRSIWENEATITVWSDLVKASVNARMLAQAFVVLLRSVNMEKMPKWWKAAKIGWWRGAAVLLQNPDISSVALHLYVFDAAVTNVLAGEMSTMASKKKKAKHIGKDVEEPDFDRIPFRNNIDEMAIYVGEGIINESMKHLIKVPIQDRMKTVFQWAVRLDVKSYDGEHNSSCMKCDDGGDLMCCEFCNQVQHCFCCSPPLNKIPDFDWACDDCVHDLSTYFLYVQKEQTRHKNTPISDILTNDLVI